MPTTVIPFGASAGAGVPGVGSAVADVTGAVVDSVSVTTSDIGKSYVYTVVVQIPLPFANLSLDLNLLGDFVLPALTALSIPRAILNFTAQAEAFFNNILADAQILISAIPEASVRIVIKIGPAIILNVLLVAEKVPVVIAPPTFKLAAPNLIADASLNTAIPFGGESVTIRVPIPYPVWTPAPLLTISGGQVSASATADTFVTTGDGGVAMAAGAGITPGGAAGGAGIAIPEIDDPIVTSDI